MTALALACQAPGTPRLDYPVEPISLDSEVHHTGEHLAQPVGVKVIEDRLVIIDRGGDHNIHVIDLGRGTLEASVGPIGEGPGEFREPVAISVDREGGAWVIDGRNLAATRLDLDQLGHPSDWYDRVISLDAPGAILDAEWTASGSLLAEVAISGHRFGSFDTAGALLARSGDLPSGDEGGYTRLLHRARIVAHPDLSELVMVGRWYPTVEILDLSGESIRRADVPVRTEPTLVSTALGFTASDDSPNAYGDVAATREYVFAIYCGRTDVSHGQSQHFGRDVHVYDWDGRLVSVLRLDRDAFTLAVDPAGEVLYTVEYDPVPAILRYELPTLPHD